MNKKTQNKFFSLIHLLNKNKSLIDLKFNWFLMARIYYSMYNVFSLLFILNRKVFINFIDLKKN